MDKVWIVYWSNSMVEAIYSNPNAAQAHVDANKGKVWAEEMPVQDDFVPDDAR